MLVDAERERLRHVPKRWDLPLAVAEAVILLVVLALVVGGIALGWAIGHEAPAHHGVTVTVTTTR